jgi:hypothetical protein
MHKLAGAEVHDLGGSSIGDPTGGDVGHKASALVGVTTPPGNSVSQSSGEKMKKLATQPQETEGSPQVKPPFATPSGEATGTAGHELAPHHEEVEASEEETISEEEASEEVSEESVEMTEEELEEAKKAKWHMMKEKMKKMGMKEDMDALFNGEELSEEFREKATAIFESAVIARAVAVVEEMEQEILSAAQETIDEVKTELEEQVDAYLSYMVEEWVQENEVAIESGLKTEIVEDFMTGLKNLFAEHYIDIPEDKVDVVEAMAEEIEELKSKLNESMNDNIELAKAITEARKVEIIASVCEGLTATQADKVKTLAEGVEFTTEGEFSKKLGIIRENYFATENSQKVKQAAKNPIALTESEEPVAVAESSSVMDRYVKALTRTLPR